MKRALSRFLPSSRGFRRASAAAAFILLLHAVNAHAQFIPGSGGSIPDIPPFINDPTMINGLTVYQTHRRNYTFGPGTHPELDLSFPTPSSYGVDKYVLQRSPDGTSGWIDQPFNGGVLETATAEYNNFSFTPDGSFHYRLRAVGGARDGQLSNIVYAPVSQIDTRFASWGIDTSMFLTGVFYPWVGHGIEVRFGVKNLPDESDVSGGLSLQWYRMNPVTREMLPISGATNPLYVTTQDDVGGWLLICRATGDQTTVGGFLQLQAGGGVEIPNRAFTSHFTEEGFRLNFFKSVPSLAPADLVLSYYDAVSMTTVAVPIDAVTPVGGNASFQVDTDLPEGITEFTLANVSPVWALGENFSAHPGMEAMFMEFLTIRLIPDITVTQPPGRALVDNQGKINFGTVRAKKRSAPKVFTVSNDGNKALSALSVSVSGPDAKDFLITPLSTGTLIPGGSTSFRVTYKPRAKGTSKAKVLVRSDDPNESPFDITVTGRGS